MTVTKSFTKRRRSIAKPLGLFGSMIRFHTFEQSSIFASIKIASFFSFFYSMAVSIDFIFFLLLVLSANILTTVRDTTKI